jgi:hypothetical protein
MSEACTTCGGNGFWLAAACTPCDGTGAQPMSASERDERLLILNESDITACLCGCGCAEPLPADFADNAAWAAEILSDPMGDEANVLCPRCLAGEHAPNHFSS